MLNISPFLALLWWANLPLQPHYGIGEHQLTALAGILGTRKPALCEGSFENIDLVCGERHDGMRLCSTAFLLK